MSAEKILLYDFPGSICCQMTRLALAEKGVPYETRTVDIMETSEQFEPWYTALNPRAVVPTLAIGDEIVTDTIHIVYRIDQEFDGPPLTPAIGAEAMDEMMRAIMGLHYGVLLYSQRRDAGGIALTIVARGHFLREQLEKYPERAKVLEKRIAGNERMQKILADPAEVDRYIEEARAVVGRIDDALSNRPFVSADHYTLADAFATAALARFRVHGLDGWWANGENPNVAGYYQRMRDRPSWPVAGVVDSGSEHDL